MTSSLDELTLFVFKLLLSFAHVLTLSCGELACIGTFALLWNVFILSVLVRRRLNFAHSRFELFILQALFKKRWMDFTHLNVDFRASFF